VEILQLTERNEDDDGLAAAIKVNLSGSRDESAVQVSLQLGSGALNVQGNQKH
jgi:hypothetical protein